jgi:thioesterase domain-containing protein/acyl carrier protein
VRVEVRDRLGRQTPTGVPGEGWIAGPTVASGYSRRDDLTAERFTGSGDERRYRTGDRLAWTDDGNLVFFGRDDEQLKLRGYRIEPGEIEAALQELANVEEAAVVLRSAAGSGPPADGDDSAQLVAFVTTRGTAAADGWRQALGDRLPAHLIPARLVRLDALPRLPNGKIGRRALQQLPIEAPPAEPAQDLTSGEQALRSLWEGLLGRTGIRATDNFFELGGHSLLVMQMVAAIEREFDASLAAADVFQHPTVRELARRIEERGENVRGYEHLFPIQSGGRRTPFIMVVPDFFTEGLAKRFRGERPVYGVRGVSLRTDGNRGRWPTMRHLAEEIADEIERRFPGRPCLLAGYSFGAWVAVETVRVLEARQVPVQHLYAIAPMPVDFYRVGPFRIRVDGLRQPLADLGVIEVIRHYARASSPLTRGPYRRARQWLFERPWRRFLARMGARRLRRGMPMTERQAQADVRVERFRLHASYRPGVVRTPTTLFNPTGLATDSAATWRPFFRGPLTVHAIPDPHDEASVAAAREQIFSHLNDLGD